MRFHRQEFEVHYRWHPYFGCTVVVRRVEQRAMGQFLKVQGPAGVVVSIAGWMLDPVACAGMLMGAPSVDLAALFELDQLLIAAGNPAHSRSDVAIVREKDNEGAQIVNRRRPMTPQLSSGSVTYRADRRRDPTPIDRLLLVPVTCSPETQPN